MVASPNPSGYLIISLFSSKALAIGGKTIQSRFPDSLFCSLFVIKALRANEVLSLTVCVRLIRAVNLLKSEPGINPSWSNKLKLV